MLFSKVCRLVSESLRALLSRRGEGGGRSGLLVALLQPKPLTAPASELASTWMGKRGTR